ncbi:MAG: hypothetical protein ACK526_10795 [Planctomyces sp.]|jgi:hypothetical protein
MNQPAWFDSIVARQKQKVAELDSDVSAIGSLTGTLLQLGAISWLITRALPDLSEQLSDVPEILGVLAFILLMLIVNRSFVPPILLLFQVSLFLTEVPSSQPGRSETTHGIEVAAFMIFVLFVTGNFTRTHANWNRIGWFILRRLPGFSENNDVQLQQVVSAILSALRAAIICIIQIVIVVSLSAFLLRFIPAARSPQEWLQLSEEGHRIINPGPELITIALAALILMSELLKRNITRSQAMIFTQTTLTNLLFSDLRMIARHQIRVRRRNFLRRQQQGTGSTSGNSS